VPRRRSSKQSGPLTRVGGFASLKYPSVGRFVLIAAGHSYKEIAKMNQWTLTKSDRCAAGGRAALKRGQWSRANNP
jgi:hypothetical protein